MGIAEKIYQHSLRLPEDAARQALAFIEFLEHQAHHQQESTQLALDTNLFSHKASKRQAGTAKQQLIVVQEDDTHLLDFKEYMS